MADTVPEITETADIVTKETKAEKKSDAIVENGTIQNDGVEEIAQKSENGDATENEDAKENGDAKKNGDTKEEEDINENGTEEPVEVTETSDVCGIKRKSEVGLDSTDGIEESIEKKQKVEEVESTVVDAPLNGDSVAETTA